MGKIDILRKRLLYQSQHRGMKEMDCILGGFAQQFLDSMSDEEVLQFETLLVFPDQELYGWFFEHVPIPENAPGRLVERIDNFIRST